MGSSPEKHLDNTEEISFTRKEIFIFVKSVLNGNINVVTDIVEMEVSKKLKHPYILPKSLKAAMGRLVSEFKKRWQQVSRNETKFFQKFDQWLNVPVSFTIENEGLKTSMENTMGRPSTSWDHLSDRSKRRRTEKIRKEHTVHELAYATQMGLRASGNLHASKVIRDVTEGSPSKASQYRKSMERVSEDVLSGNEALSLVVEGKMTKSQYQLIRSVSVKKNCKLYPPYKCVLDSKKKCYPAKSEISVTESGATVGLQALLNHTAERILMVQSDVIESLPENKVDNLELICKWGCDGTSGQRTYKQKFSDGGNKSDANIFFISLVPLQIFDRVNPHVIIWKNPRPSSPRFCRPIKIGFLHETAEATRAEVDCIEAQQRSLVPFQIVIGGKKININFKLVLTMIDSKVCNSLLPIGQMSEEAQESCNKYIKRFRENFLRKCDRIKNMEDIFCKLLVMSDPIISSLRKHPPKKQRSLSPYAVELLIPPSVTESSQISSNDTSDASDDDDNSQDSD
ncbi:PREDICTED: uncharacterized protein LOC105562053 [Vollenhovia emeryi]|uniref:uncharacterized protein LOC105562053 n=1 Tax=Vollenhovia emeryi TaxID=411798 RepID=UPI0005F4E775|nr:PREDICTED: uncharacterized protein LOC105562053 [Vollenhovia emeryi]